MKLQEKIDTLKLQQEQAKEVFIKCQGAIEILSSMVEEENKAHSQSPVETLKGSHKEDK